MAYWKDKVVLVTGASRGFGQVLARTFARAGAKVAITARGTDTLDAAAEDLRRIGSDVLARAADVTRQEDVDELFAAILERFGGLDCLVNNAGRSMRRAVLDTTAEEFAQLMELNLGGAVRCTRAAVPHLLQRRGHVVNIGSLGSKAAAKFLGAYPATKFALAAYTQQLRMELGPQGLHALLVCPGPIARDDSSSLTREELESVPPEARGPGAGVKHMGVDPEKLAEAILKACRKRRIELVRPRRARLLFILMQVWPRLGDAIIRKST